MPKYKSVMIKVPFEDADYSVSIRPDDDFECMVVECVAINRVGVMPLPLDFHASMVMQSFINNPSTLDARFEQYHKVLKDQEENERN